MKIYTRRGDRGETSLWSGERVAKDSLRVESYGTVDETTATLGLCLAETKGDERLSDLADLLRIVQGHLFEMGTDLAQSADSKRDREGIRDTDVAFLESAIDRFDEELSPLRKFILPGGTRLAACLHLARTVCRRAERIVVTLARQEPVRPVVVRYLNRLSDLLFTMARVANKRLGESDPEWDPR